MSHAMARAIGISSTTKAIGALRNTDTNLLWTTNLTKNDQHRPSEVVRRCYRIYKAESCRAPDCNDAVSRDAHPVWLIKPIWQPVGFPNPRRTFVDRGQLANRPRQRGLRHRR